MELQFLRSVSGLKGKKVLLRLDLNVPVRNGKVVDNFRIKKILPTVEYLKNQGAKIIIISHFENKESMSLRPVYDYFVNFFSATFIDDYVNDETREIVNGLKDGGIVMFENLRMNEAEKKNDKKFAQDLASLADIYVNDAFSVSHREHASIVGVPKYIKSYAGFLFEDEITNLRRVLNPTKPFTFIVGGAKFETKLPFVEKFFSMADTVFVGGALAHDFFKAQGYEIGKSLVSSGSTDYAKMIKTGKVVLPVDVIVKNENGTVVKDADKVLENDVIMDAGPESISRLKQIVFKSKFVLWNGPLGNYEVGFKEGTIELAKVIAQDNVESVVGGGDTLAAISTLGLESKFGFISTGGGAMLDFLAKETLPGIEALKAASNS